MDLSYWLYMNEAEGYDNMVNTRSARINAIGRELVERGYKGKTVPEPVLYVLCHRHDLLDITKDEVKDIEERWL